MDTLFNLEVLRSVYVFKDLNSTVKDVNTSLEKTTKGIQSLSDSFSSFTRSSIEKVKELSSEFRELTKSITQPQVAALSFDTSGAMNEFSKISSMAQGLSEMSYKENFTQSVKSSASNAASEVKQSEEKKKEENTLMSYLDTGLGFVKKLKEVYDSIEDIGKMYRGIRDGDLLKPFKKDSSSSSEGNGSETSKGKKDTKGLLSSLGDGIEIIDKLKSAYDTFNDISDLFKWTKNLFKRAAPAATAVPEAIPAAGEGAVLAEGLLPGLGEVAGLSGSLVEMFPALEGVGIALAALAEFILPVLAIVAAVVAVVVAIKLLWDHSKRFREMLGYISGAGKAVFHNIGVYATRLWQVIIKPLLSIMTGGIQFIVSKITGFFSSAKMKTHNFITESRKFINESIEAAVSFVKEKLNRVINFFNKAKAFIGKSWSEVSNVFTDLKKWISFHILDPMTEAFDKISSKISGVIDKITGKAKQVLAPVKKIWDQIFSPKGILDVNKEGLKSKKEAGDNFDAQKRKEKNKEEADKRIENEKNKVSNSKKNNAFESNSAFNKEFNFKNFGSSALNNVQSRNSSFGGSMGSGTGAGGGQKSVGNLNITKLIENMNIYNQNNTMSKEAIIQMVREALLTAVADFTLAQKDNY